MQLWQKSMEFYGGLQSNDRIDSFEPVILSSHGGDLNRYMLLRGNADKLADVQEDDIFRNIVIERIVLESFQATSVKVKLMFLLVGQNYLASNFHVSFRMVLKLI